MGERIGFIGLGIMGGGMAANLLGAGFDVTVWNRTPAKSEALGAKGAKRAASPRAVAEASDIVLVCVSDTPDVREVIFGEEGVARGAREGMLVVDHSTIAPGETKRIAEELRGRGVRFVDAPVSGGSEGAAKGTLSIMAGGEAEDIERAMPCFNAMGKAVTHVGPAGAGQLVKAVNQTLVVGTTLAMAEAFLLAEAGGLDLRKTLDAVKDGAAGSWMLSNRGPQILDRDFRPGFTIDLLQKDLRLVLETADELGVPLPGTALIFQLYRTLQRAGDGDRGNHGLVLALERLAGFEVGAGGNE